MQQDNKELMLAGCDKAEHTLHAQQGKDIFSRISKIKI